MTNYITNNFKIIIINCIDFNRVPQQYKTPNKGKTCSYLSENGGRTYELLVEHYAKDTYQGGMSIFQINLILTEISIPYNRNPRWIQVHHSGLYLGILDYQVIEFNLTRNWKLPKTSKPMKYIEIINWDPTHPKVRQEVSKTQCVGLRTL